jgi:large subunit ribosomal protein L10e
MGLRPAKCYRWQSPAYTRVSKNPGDSYITGIPGTKLNRMETGNLQAEFDTEISIATTEDIQIRSNALEASRVSVNKILEAGLGINNFRLKVRVYPHHIIRENVMATGAGADRVQMGMRLSFGKPIGQAARIRVGQKIMTIYVNKSDQALALAKKAMKTANIKLPCKCVVTITTKKKKTAKKTEKK